MGEAEGGRRRHLLLRPVEQRIEAVVTIRLKDSAELGKVSLRVLATPIAGGVEHRGRRGSPRERLIVAYVNPYAPGRAFAPGQDRDRRIVAMQPFGLEHMRLDHVEERLDGEGDMADLISQRLGRQIDALAFESRALAVQRHVLPELVEHDRRQQIGAEEAARCGMEWRGSLADRLAVAAGKLLAHRLDDLEAARDLFQRLRHVLAQLRQPRAATTGACRRRFDDDALTLDILRPWLAHRPLAREGAHSLRFGRGIFGRQFVLGGRRHEFLELQFQLVDQPLRALAARPVLLALQLSDQQLQVRDQSLGTRQLRLRIGCFRFSLDPRRAFGQQRRMGAGEVRRQGKRRQRHAAIESDFPTISTHKSRQTRVGRQVS